MAFLGKYCGTKIIFAVILKIYNKRFLKIHILRILNAFLASSVYTFLYTFTLIITGRRILPTFLSKSNEHSYFIRPETS